MNEKPRLTIDLKESTSGYAYSGTRPNAFSIIEKARKCLEQAGQPEAAKALIERFHAFAWIPVTEPGKPLKDAKQLIEEYCQVTWLNE
jgi:DTW domain-containing protein YfiP